MADFVPMASVSLLAICINYFIDLYDLPVNVATPRIHAFSSFSYFAKSVGGCGLKGEGSNPHADSSNVA
jgi:hypothetical protein